MSTFNWREDLPSGFTSYPLIQQVPCSGRNHWLVLSRGLTVIDTHWDRALGAKGQSLPHWAPPQHCDGCERHLSLRPRVFLGALWWQHKKICVLELTGGSVLNCPALRPAATPDLRGRVLETWRERPNGASPVCCMLGPIPSQLPDPMPDVDVIGVLLRRYSVDVGTARGWPRLLRAEDDQRAS